VVPTRLFALAVCVLAVSACSTTVDMGWYLEKIEQDEALAVPYVRQTSQTDCGVAALASVMEYYQVRTHSQQALLDRYPPASPHGYSLGELRDIARAHDFVGFVVPGDQAFLRNQLSRKRPLIVPLRVRGTASGLTGVSAGLLERAFDTGYDHYVVVVGIDDERRTVVVMDPARGPAQFDFEEFAASWDKTNHAVLLVGETKEAD
jgi:ABC-type bacteriocin/lantibiotic exporter with double-glycine peptidase domain